MALVTLRAEIYNGLPTEGAPIATTTIRLTEPGVSTWVPNIPAGSASDNPPKTLLLHCLSGPIFVAVGSAPDPTVEPRIYLHHEKKIEVRMRVADKVAFTPT